MSKPGNKNVKNGFDLIENHFHFYSLSCGVTVYLTGDMSHEGASLCQAFPSRRGDGVVVVGSDFAGHVPPASKSACLSHDMNLV